MSFESYVNRIMSLNKYCRKQINPKQIVQKGFQVKKTNMEMTTIRKTQFTGWNNKKFDFFLWNCFFPFGYYLLENFRQEKKI